MSKNETQSQIAQLKKGFNYSYSFEINYLELAQLEKELPDLLRTCSEEALLGPISHALGLTKKTIQPTKNNDCIMTSSVDVHKPLSIECLFLQNCT